MTWKRMARSSSTTSCTTQQMGGQPAAIFADVPLAKRVNHYIEWSGSGILLDVASAVLSLLTVMTYMVETHYTEYDGVWLALRIVDQVASFIFAAEWLFWLWLARNRLGYIFSWQSLVDIITIVPIFISLFVSRRVPGFAAFEAMVRIFRVVRVFRVFRLGKRLKNEVLSRLLTLVFTLLAIIVTAAGIFYELETRFSDHYPDLTIEQAIYWSVVTTTTIGYGDFSPSITASQMTLLAMLLIAFTLLPYQTSVLVNALSETTVYQSAHFSHATRGHHVVVTGHLTAFSARTVVDELFHPDSGFADYVIVFLQPTPPTDAMKKLLKTSQHAHRLMYLQGSWASQEDLARAQVELCDAIFILTNKAPADAKQEDLQTIMTCLAIGQYIQRKEKARLKVGPRPVLQRLRDLFRRFLLLFQKAKQHGDIPRVCIQLLLPESKQHLHHLLGLYAKQGLLCTQQTPAQRHPETSTGMGWSHDAAATIITRGADLKKQDSKGRIGGQPGSRAAIEQDAAASGATAAAAAGGPAWWQRFCRQLTCICITELRFGLLSQQCMGCDGAITLVSNLVRSVDDGVLTKAEFEQLPEWAQEYLEGSSNELYEVARFPTCLHGETIAQVAQYLLEVFRAVLLATVGATSGNVSQVQPDKSMATSEETTGTNAGCNLGPAAIASVAARPQPSQADGKHVRLQLGLPSLTAVITQQTAAYVIASDVRVVLDIMESTADDYSSWKAAKPRGQDLQGLAKPLGRHTMAYVQPAVAGGAWKTPSTQNSPAAAMSSSGTNSDQQPGQLRRNEQQMANGCMSSVQTAAAYAQDGCQQAWRSQGALEQHGAGSSMPLLPTSCSSSDAVSAQDGLLPSAGTLEAHCQVANGAPDALSSSGLVSQSAFQHYPDTASNSRRSTAEQSSNGSNFRRAGAAAFMGVSARSLLAALPGPLGSVSPAGHEGGTHNRQRRQRGAIQVNIRCAAALADNTGGAVDVPESPQGGPTQRLLADHLSAPSQRRRRTMELSMQRAYHTRDLSMTAEQCMQAMTRDEVHLDGHLLVCGCHTPPAALACLLKPLRSTGLTQAAAVQPVVVLDTIKPMGLEWEQLARLVDVYYIEGSAHDVDALLRAGAATAATALVLLPWSQHITAAGVDDLVTAGMVDASVLAVVRLLRAVNPCVQVMPELNQYQSLRFLDPLGSLLDGCSVDEATAAAASPAFMSGAVLLPLMDILVCQAVNNRGVLQLLSSILSQWHHRPSSRHFGRLQQQQQPTSAATPAADPCQDTAGLPVDDGSNLAQPHCAQAGVLATLTAACASEQAAQQPMHHEQQTLHQGFNSAAVLLQVPVHSASCSTFGELFEWLLQHEGMLCCGLYRRAMHCGRPMSYVYTNPHKDTLLQTTDRAFVLATLHHEG